MSDTRAELRVLARKAHNTVEPIHVLGYFCPEGGEVYSKLGLKSGMQQYFATRSACLGVVPSEVVIATFYNFEPTNVARAVPAAWQTTTPEAMIAARLEMMDLALTRILGEGVLKSEEMAEAASIARDATTALDGVGRPLYAAHSALAWPEPAHLQLFHAQTLLREHRGDAHVAALMLAGLDGVEALVSYLPLGVGLPEELLQVTRGWDSESWEAARVRLRERGLLDADNKHTDAGKAQRDLIETQTDDASVAAWAHLGPERTTQLRDLVRPWSKAITTSMFGG